MNDRDRFRETIAYGSPDRVPLYDEGIRDEVLETWRAQGLAPERPLTELFLIDRRAELQPDLEPRPPLTAWPTSFEELNALRRRLSAADPARLPVDWVERVQAWRQRDHVLMLRVHEGLFETLGVSDWDRFSEVIYLLADQPDLAREMLTLSSLFAAELIERILAEVEIDAAVFSEPIAGHYRSLISPRMYEELVLPTYEPILAALRHHQVQTVIMRTYANTRVLLPAIVRRGFNCLWACETNPEEMDYLDIRRTFGPDLRLIGGIDVDLLLGPPEQIQPGLEALVLPLLAEGGFIPLADGRVRGSVPFANYRLYREKLTELVLAHPPGHPQALNRRN